MVEFALTFAIIGICLAWVAWRDHANGNSRDSTLMAGLGVCSFIGSAGLFAATI